MKSCQDMIHTNLKEGMEIHDSMSRAIEELQRNNILWTVEWVKAYLAVWDKIPRKKAGRAK